MVDMNDLKIFIPYLLMFISLLFPFLYISFKKGINKFLFISSCAGSLTIILTLIYIFPLPYSVFSEKIVPQLAVNGQLEYILPLLHFFEIVNEYHLVVLLPILYIALPILIFKRYPIFKK